MVEEWKSKKVDTSQQFVPEVAAPKEKKLNLRNAQSDSADNISQISSIAPNDEEDANKSSSSASKLRTNSYSAIHGISKRKDDEDDLEETRADPTDSYAARSKKDINYKAYSLNDYNKMNSQGYVKMGGLGPDLQNEALLEKKEKASKMKEYAKEVAQANKNLKKKPVAQPSVLEETKVTARDKALEFASKIPKPKTKRSSRNIVEDEPHPLTELEKLELQHERDREWLKKEFDMD